MNKTELKAKVKDNLGNKINLNFNNVSKIVDGVFDTISDELAKGNSVNIFGFGKFETYKTREHLSINPITGEKMTIPETVRVSFKSSKELKRRLNERK